MTEECIICFNETDQFVFLPCAHKLCAYCKEHLEHKKCPMCNTLFEVTETQIQLIPETRPIQRHKASMCSKGTGLFLCLFAGYIAYQSLNYSEF